ncbi:hypothetical protein LTR66_005621 [Elasticomyces elasticus]|nr:hypothetical protein LTR66_005621 [Elasticomyces elasticus]
MLGLLLLLFAVFLRVKARVLRRNGSQASDRTWQAAVQNINGINSILTLLPVLTGKAQNVKLVASRILPASSVIAGIGAGRVLAKLQVGILLLSFDLYRNTVAELSYPHDEYVNKFSPILDHIPTATPERHATGKYVNHNPSEAYMVETWFQSEGRSSVVELRQTNNWRMIGGASIYLLIYADNSGKVFLGLQITSVALWLSASAIVQVWRGQGNSRIELNKQDSSEYRCFRLPMSGKHVSSVVFSFDLNNLERYQLFRAKYDHPTLSIAGAVILVSGVLDILSTVLIVGLTTWAYPWIGFELLVIVAKIIFCLEPLRPTEVERVILQDTGSSQVRQNGDNARIPVNINTSAAWSCQQVCAGHVTLYEHATSLDWRSTSAGISIGQEYAAIDGTGKELIDGMGKKLIKFLVLSGGEHDLELADDRPVLQTNQALDREFLAALAVTMRANKVPSGDFLAAMERTAKNIEATMTPHWYRFGAKNLFEEIRTAKRDLIWRKYF